MKDLLEDPDGYPGSSATPDEILVLASAYAAAARALPGSAGAGGPLSYAPARLCAIHAVELFLNAFLRFGGAPPAQVRARHHDLVDADFCQTLRLRKKTAEHLAEMTRRREYLISRYAPDMTRSHTEVNRLGATLDEVEAKISAFLR
ncbi:hypothetical protein BCF33_0284 [Hasllibacter halocynthiae]|uniref:HEPN domain-containing protein n=1 Tax=Hasllibacter halocynthiae TaxID=595589 RepID=A0A2T0X6W2_9RHOB|nr:hypothetical protein [Hasllibacter halocynthiae]PRY94690.1 hypothetical protein BCF33_0284 [Hasllibacter halocynthiae]